MRTRGRAADSWEGDDGMAKGERVMGATMRGTGKALGRNSALGPREGSGRAGGGVHPDKARRDGADIPYGVKEIGRDQ